MCAVASSAVIACVDTHTCTHTQHTQTHKHKHTHIHIHKHYLYNHIYTLSIAYKLTAFSYSCVIYDGSQCNSVLGLANITAPSGIASSIYISAEDAIFGGLMEQFSAMNDQDCKDYKVSSSGASPITLPALALLGVVPTPEMN